MRDNGTGQKKSIMADHIQKKTKPREQLETEILEFLNEASSHPGTTDKPGCPLKHGLACVLATAYRGVPRATPIDFFADGLTIWLAGEPGLKIRNIRSNPHVAVGIYHPMDHSVLNRSLQITGTASLVSYAGEPDLFLERLRRMGVYDAARKVLAEMLAAKNGPLENLDQEALKAVKRFNLIKIEPAEITFLRIHPTEGTQKDIWKQNGSPS
jgi:hypothetical protein